MKTLALIAVSLAVAGCKTVDPFVVTAESLDQVGAQFVTTADLFNAAHDQHLIDDAGYGKWRTFGLHFQDAYPLAVQLWKSTQRVTNKILEGQISEILQTLILELGAFAVQVQTLIGRMIAAPAAPPSGALLDFSREGVASWVR